MRSVQDQLAAVPAGVGPVPPLDVALHPPATAVQDAGATAIRVDVVGDDRATPRAAIADQLVRADLLPTTGGLSDTDRDTVKDVLAPLGTVRFEHVAMSPGRRQGFGTVGAPAVVPEDDAAARPGDHVHCLVLEG